MTMTTETARNLMIYLFSHYPERSPSEATLEIWAAKVQKRETAVVHHAIEWLIEADDRIPSWKRFREALVLAQEKINERRAAAQTDRQLRAGNPAASLEAYREAMARIKAISEAKQTFKAVNKSIDEKLKNHEERLKAQEEAEALRARKAALPTDHPMRNV